MNKKKIYKVRIKEDYRELSDNELQRKLDRLYGFSTDEDKENNFWNDHEVIDSDIFSNEDEDKDEENVDNKVKNK